MTPNHPIPPERIRAEAERVVNEWAERHDGATWSQHTTFRCDRFIALVAAGVAMVDVATVQREAVSNALGYIYGQFAGHPAVDKDVALAVVLLALRGKEGYLAREYPAPRECVLLSNGERVEYNGKVRYRGYTWDTVAGFLQRDNERGYVLTMDELRQLMAFAERAK